MVGKTLSHYRILEELGRGGMGIVYKGEDTKLHRTVAIKVLPAAALSSEEDRARFYREARAAASLAHPNIAVIHEIDEAVPEGSKDDDLRPFIAMEFIEGDTLEDKIKQGPLKLEEAVRIASEVASALEAAHEQDIVHRDIKVANVMLTAKGSAKVLDFGLAQTAHSTKLTRMGSTLGTVAYMSPEQARGEAVDHRADIWALGVTLYEMVAGRHPFAGDYEQAVVYSILNEDPEPLTAIRTGVPMGLEWIINKMIAKKAAHRYQSTAEILVDLETVDLSQAGMSRVSTASTLAAPISANASMDPTFSKTTLAAVLVTAVVVFGLSRFFTPGKSPDTPILEYPIAIPGIVSMEDPEVSPDRTRIAFQGRDTTGRVGIFEWEMTPEGQLWYLDGSEDRNQPSYSPEGEMVTYSGGGFWGLKYHSSPGGPPQNVPDTEDLKSTGAQAWLTNGDMLARDENNTVFRVSMQGTRELIVSPDSTKRHSRFYLNHADPSGRFVAMNIFSEHSLSAVQIGILDLEKKDYWSLGREGTVYPYFVGDDYLMYIFNESSSGVLPGIPMIQKITADRRMLEGTAVPAFPDEPEVAGYAFTIGPDGALYRAAQVSDFKYSHLLRYELTPGSASESISRFLRGSEGWTPSPDGKKLVQIRNGLFYTQLDRQIQLLHQEGDEFRLETVFSEDSLYGATWDVDGSSLYFNQISEGRVLIKHIPVDLSSPARTVLEDALFRGISDDGSRIVFTRPIFEEGRLVRVNGVHVYDLQSGVIETHRDSARLDYAAFSPDGVFLAMSGEIDGDEGVFVERLFEENLRKMANGIRPIWDPNGEYLYFTGLPLRALRRIPISQASGFRRMGEEETLFDQWFADPFTIDFTNNKVYTSSWLDVDVTKDARVIRIENFEAYVKQRMGNE